METSTPAFQELIARRLLEHAEVNMARPKKRGQAKTQLPATTRSETQLAPTEFVNGEKNLTSRGVFTPSSKKINNAKSNTITFTRTVEGKKVDARVTIVPAALYRLPITADQDKYFALQKLINDRRQETGQISNPIG